MHLAADRYLPLWPLPLLLAVLPTVAVHVAYALSIEGGHVPGCVPYLEGCTSVSRAARHGLGNHLFRLVMLPCAAIHLLHWICARHWLPSHGAPRTAGAALPWLGAVAALALAVYATFLGTEGDAYRFMRRYGVVFYFAATYIAQLEWLRQRRMLPMGRDTASAAMLGIAVALLAMGLASVAVSALVADEALQFRLENILEWWLGALTAIWFAFIARIWWRDGFGVRFSLR